MSSVSAPAAKRKVPWPVVVVVGIVLLLGLGASQLGQKSDKDKIVEYVEDANAKSSAKLQSFESGVPISPDDREDLAAAAVDFEKAKRLSPGVYNMYYTVGFVYTALEDWRHAEDNLSAGLKLVPKQPSAEDLKNIAQMHYLYSRVLMATGRAGLAEQEADQAVKFEPAPNYLWARATARVQLHNLEGAQEDLRQALTAAPGHTPSISLLKFIGNMK